MNVARLLLVVPLLAAVGCGPAPPAESGRPRVVTTFSVLGDFVREVGGDRAERVTLVGSDGDAHTYQPTPQDVAAVGRAAVVFENGAGFEAGWFDKVYAASGSKASRVVAVDGLKLVEGNHHPFGEEAESGHTQEVDPHVWHEVTNAAHMVGKVRDGLAAADPANAAFYRANADAYLARLRDLDAWVVTAVATLPPDRRKLVTSHDTFGYFARRYGFTVAGTVLPSFSTEAADPSAAAFAGLAEKVRREKVPVVFCEASGNPKLVDRLAAAAGVRLAPPLYTDALGPAGSPGATYEGMMRHNVTTIVDALKP